MNDKVKRIEELEAEAMRLRAELDAERISKQSEGVQRLDVITRNIQNQVDLGMEISEEYGITWRFPGPGYGMGGEYNPNSNLSGYSDAGWNASSHSC